MRTKYKFKVGDIVEVIHGRDKGTMRRITSTRAPALHFTRDEPYYALEGKTWQRKDGRDASIWFPESFLQHTPLGPKPMQREPDKEP